MSQAPASGSFWQSARQLPERMPRRVRLIAAVLVLVVIALTLISFAGIYVLRGNLLAQVDAELGAEANRVQTAIQTGYSAPARAFAGAAAVWVPDTGARVQVLQATNSNGSPVAGPDIPADAASLPLNPNDAITIGSTTDYGRWRVIGVPSRFASSSNGPASDGILVVGVDADNVYSTLRTLTGIDVLVSLVIIVAIAGLGTAVVRASLRPLNDMEQTAGAIAAGDLSRRVPEADPRTEVGRLGRSLNTMLSQIESAFGARSRSEAEARRSEERMRQFVGDASHELRTPLTAIRGFAEYYRQRGGVAPGGEAATNGDAGRPGQLAPADLDRIMRRVEQEAARMGVLVEDMLLLARLDQQRPLESRPVDLLTLAADAVHDARVVAPARDINLTVGSGAALLIIGDEVRLRQVIGNLMSNALTHTPDGTAIDVLIRSGNLDEAPAPAPPPPDWPAELEAGEAQDRGQDNPPGAPVASPDTAGEYGPESWNAPAAAAPGPHPAAVLEVSDHGPGLTKEQADHVFERFYRADQARTAGGTGLGLAIVAALVAAHGGATWVRTRPGEGATFCIALPLSADALQGPDDDDDADDLADETPVPADQAITREAGPDAPASWAGAGGEGRVPGAGTPATGVTGVHENARGATSLTTSGRQDLTGRSHGGFPVRAAEQADVHQERMQLMQ
jgi:two-component system OmpR family sensor kinase